MVGILGKASAANGARACGPQVNRTAPGHDTAGPRAAQAAEINITAAKSFNRGLNAIYFALCGLAWLIGPWTLLAATLITTAVLLRREFDSHSRQIILGKG